MHRRQFLQLSTSSSAALIIAFQLPACASARLLSPGEITPSFAPNAFLQITSDGNVTIWCAKSEVGQGVRTSLPMIVAEELGCDWQRVSIAQADLDPKFGNQGTGGSLSVRTSYANLRKAGAAAREMLLTAAASHWHVPSSECRVEHSFVLHSPTQRKLPFHQLIAAAAELPAPQEPPLRDPKSFQLIGKSTRRTDSLLKVTGAAKFGLDSRIPGMLVASIERCPAYGGTPRKHNADQIKSLPGVRAVVEIPAVHLTHQFGEESGPTSRNYTCSGVAVVADSTWAAMQARTALRVEWTEPQIINESTATLSEKMRQLIAQPAPVIRNDGDFNKAHPTAAKQIEAIYEVPFLAHATMEPVNCTAHVRVNSCELWAPTQIPGAAADSVAKALNIPRENIKVHVTFIGGGFGRRLIQDYAVEAALLSQKLQAPVQVVWTREDDIRHDFYRPAAAHFLQAGLDARGNLVSWLHRGSGPSIDVFYTGTNLTPAEASQLDEISFPADAVPNYRIEFALADSLLPLGYWRSVGNSGNQFVISSFFDEAAHAVGRDPLEFLLATLGPARKLDLGGDRGIIDVARRRRVIELAAEKSGWSKPLAKPRGRGIAAHFGYGSYVAQVAEVTCDPAKGTLRIERVVCAIDCGTAINPLGVEAQMQSAINFGLAQTLKSEITISKGRVDQSNFHDYEVLRMNDAPPIIEVHIVPSTDLPGGCGEPGVPPIAPAVANALFAATGKRLRRLPIRPADLRSA